MAKTKKQREDEAKQAAAERQAEGTPEPPEPEVPQVPEPESKGEVETPPESPEPKKAKVVANLAPYPHIEDELTVVRTDELAKLITALIFDHTMYVTGQPLKTLVMRMFGKTDYQEGLKFLNELSKIARKGR